MPRRIVTVLACFLIGGFAAVLQQVMFPPPVIAHAGRTDSFGCHNDRRQGEYHCHSGPLAGQAFDSKAEASRALASSEGTTPTPVPRPTTSSARPPTPTPPATRTSVAPAVPYDRDLYRHWTDADGDCQDARQEVLIAESVQIPEMDERGCRVVSGRWLDPYTGLTFTDPGDLDIDHFIPLAEVHRSGGDTWTAERREAYANDLFHRDGLIAVSASANRSKGDRDPADWLPPNESYQCDYVRKWVLIKVTWGLDMDADEQGAVQRVLAGCS